MPGEKFNVRLAPEEGGSPEPVTVEVGLEGFNLLYPGSGRVLRKYPLHHISRWSSQGNKLILFTKSPVRRRGPGAPAPGLELGQAGHPPRAETRST